MGFFFGQIWIWPIFFSVSRWLLERFFPLGKKMAKFRRKMYGKHLKTFENICAFGRCSLALPEYMCKYMHSHACVHLHSFQLFANTVSFHQIFCWDQLTHARAAKYNVVLIQMSSEDRVGILHRCTFYCTLFESHKFMGPEDRTASSRCGMVPQVRMRSFGHRPTPTPQKGGVTNWFFRSDGSDSPPAFM